VNFAGDGVVRLDEGIRNSAAAPRLPLDVVRELDAIAVDVEVAAPPELAGRLRVATAPFSLDPKPPNDGFVGRLVRRLQDCDGAIRLDAREVQPAKQILRRV